MKKITCIILFVAGLSALTKAQNSMSVNIGKDLCLSVISVVFTDDTQHYFDLGCSGDYSFDIGNNVVRTVSINGTVCEPDKITRVKLDNGESADATAPFSQYGPHISVSAPGVK